MNSDSENEEQPTTTKESASPSPAPTDEAIGSGAETEQQISLDPSSPLGHTEEATPASDSDSKDSPDEPAERSVPSPAHTPDAKAPKPKRTRRPRPEGARKQAPQKASPQTKRRHKQAQSKPRQTEPVSETRDSSHASSGNTGAQKAAPSTEEGGGIAARLKNLKLPKPKAPTLDDVLHPTLTTKIVLGVIALWIVGIVFFWSRYLPGTIVNGIDASWKTTSSLADSFDQKANDYELNVWDQRISLTLSGSDLNLAFDKDAFERATAHRLQKVFWPIALLLPKTYTVTQATTFNEGHLQEACQQAVESANVEAGGSANATVAYDEATGTYVGVAESEGTRLDQHSVYTAVSGAVSTLQEMLKLTESVLEQPTVVESDPRFASAVEKAQEYPSLSIDLRLSNVVVETIDQTRYRNWLAISDDYDICANVQAIEDWTKGDLSAKLDSVGAFRSWTRWDGKQCQVYDGTYGWVIDGAALAAEIASRINERSEIPIEVPCVQRAALYNPGGPDWGNRSIEVDMTEQYVRMYDAGGSIIWESECVTGNESKNDGTVIGVYAIENKKSPEKLVGLDNDGDGEPDYENEVEFWMPFYGGYGLHDALWRDTFNYDTYLTDGSHGCVNLPYYAAASLYELCEIGDPVIVHW